MCRAHTQKQEWIENVKTAIIIDDHQLFSGGFKHVLTGLHGVENAVSFDNPQSAIEAEFDEDVVLVVSDLYIPGYDMFIWIDRLRAHFDKAGLAVVSSSISRTDRRECLLAGADAYFEKHADPDLVVEGFSALLAKTKVQDGFLERTAREAQDIGLTHKQIDILVHLSRGLSLKEVAIRFEISPETVKTHLSNIYYILGVSGRSAASDWAKRHGLI
jgi:DNA-binding NarL/FixJ family response regulator